MLVLGEAAEQMARFPVMYQNLRIFRLIADLLCKAAMILVSVR